MIMGKLTKARYFMSKELSRPLNMFSGLDSYQVEMLSAPHPLPQPLGLANTSLQTTGKFFSL